MEEAAQAGAVAEAFRPFDLTDPFGFYARAREEAPIFFSEQLDCWVVSRYDDIRTIFKDPATFSSENTQSPYKPRPPEVTRVFQEAGITHSSSGLSGIQPPDHTRLRGFIKKAFTPRRIALLEPEIRELAVEMIDRMAANPRADLVGDLVFELPALVVFHLVGVPDEDVPKVKEWAASRVLLNFGDRPLAEQVHHAENMVAYWQYCISLVETNFEEPRDDLTGALAQIYLEGDQSISKEEIAGLIHTQLFAGHETTTSLLGEGLRLLLAQPERWAELCRDPELIPTAVEEMLRTSTPVFAWKRKTKAPATVCGVDLPEGSSLLMLLGSANRDPAVFDDGEHVDLHRENAHNHLAFGHGIHFCLGAPLARLEAQVVLEELIRRVPDMRLVPGQSFSYHPNTTFRGPRRVLVEWGDALVLPFEQCLSGDVDIVGGKAASLGALTAAGLPVPAGFAVTTHAYRAAVDGPADSRRAGRGRRARARVDRGRGAAGRGAGGDRRRLRAPVRGGGRRAGAGGRPLERDRRGLRRRQLRRPAGHLPVDRGRGGRARAREALLGQPLLAALDRLPALARDRRGRAPDGCGRAADGATRTPRVWR